PPCATGCSRAQGPSGASPARSSAHRTPGATDNTSPRSRRSGGLRPPCSGPERPEHLSAATWRRSLQACIASLPLQSSLMSKTYLKSDHFNGGGASSSRRLGSVHGAFIECRRSELGQHCFRRMDFPGPWWCCLMEVLPSPGEEFPRPRPNLPLETATLGRGSRLHPKHRNPLAAIERRFNIGTRAPLRVHYFRRTLVKSKGR